jgi:hypothetical protein
VLHRWPYNSWNTTAEPQEYVGRSEEAKRPANHQPFDRGILNTLGGCAGVADERERGLCLLAISCTMLPMKLTSRWPVMLGDRLVSETRPGTGGGN